MSSSCKAPIAVAIGATLTTGLLLSGAAFAINPLAQGYMLGASAVEKAAEGKCGEGKCGKSSVSSDKMDTSKDGRISRAEFAAAHAGDASNFAAHDSNRDGFISATEMKARQKGAGKASNEGKCGEGKCGGGI